MNNAERLMEENTDRTIFAELEKLSNKLKQSEQLKSHFLSNIRNEINNPISAVLGLSKFLMNAEKLDEAQLKRHAFMIHHEIFNLNFQMQNIFAAAELEAGEMTIEPSLVDIKKVVTECVASVRFKAEQKQVAITTKFENDEQKFVSDKNMLYLIVINLLINAIEYSLVKSEVLVTCSIVEEKLIIKVQDRGLGIEKGDVPKIFERFYQLDYGSTKQHSGQGLGLSVIKELADALNAVLSVTSARNEGSVFTITIPPLEEDTSSLTASDNWNEFLFTNDTIL